MQLQKVSPYVLPGIALPPVKQKPHKLHMLTIDDVVTTVCTGTGVPKESLVLRTHARQITDARFIIYYLGLKFLQGVFTNNIYRLIGIQHDHSTVIHGRKAIEDRISIYADFRKQIQIMETELHRVHSSRLVGKAPENKTAA